jgi:hypothetical protein
MIRGLTADEMAKALDVSLATVYRDMEEVRQRWKVLIAKEDLHTIRQAFDTMTEFERQLWMIFQEEPKHHTRTHKRGKKTFRETIVEDVTWKKLGVIDRLTRLLDMKNHMAGLITQPSGGTSTLGSEEEKHAQWLADFINKAPAKLAAELESYVRDQQKLSRT